MSDRAQVEHTGRVIRDEVRTAASPDEVYRAWSEPESITGWFVGGMDGRMAVGETVRWFWADQGPGMTQEVVVADPPHRLVTRMDLPHGPSYLEVTIQGEGDHSLVRLVQSGFGEGPEWDAEYESMLSGWMVALAVLKFFVERYFDRKREEIVILADASFEREEILDLQRSEGSLSKWLSRSGGPGQEVVTRCGSSSRTGRPSPASCLWTSRGR